jgi:hypothetical protein
MRIAAGVAAGATVLIAVALLWLAGEAHYRGCVDHVSARYPPIAVSAFSTQETGPLKVAYDAERTQALEDCSRVPW